MFRILSTLQKAGVMGINERNVRYVSALNPRRLLSRVDNKLITKKIALAAGIPVPPMYGAIANARDMKGLDQMIDRPEGFVIKPAQGSQGKGINVIERPLHDGWRLASGKRILRRDIEFHINNIMSGMYSLGGQPDKALIEYRVQFDDVFDDISFKGVPDIRVIVLKGIPVFAMLRLPTSESDGKANLHKGGVGVGINIATGITMQAMQHDRLIDIHPDTANPLEGLKTPYWDEILTIAAKSYSVTGLGFLGVDVVLDRSQGPLLLEMNARPGISIQIANRMGMRGVLEKAASLECISERASDRVQAAKKLAVVARGMSDDEASSSDTSAAEVKDL